jgi:hypothetical protein
MPSRRWWTEDVPGQNQEDDVDAKEGGSGDGDGDTERNLNQKKEGKAEQKIAVKEETLEKS